MSFAKTTDAVRERRKDVTRRVDTWWFIKPGDRLCAVVKGMGLRKGEKVERLATIEIVSVSRERLCDITPDEVRREGFPDMTVDEFIGMFCREIGCEPDRVVNRIEFKYVD